MGTTFDCLQCGRPTTKEYSHYCSVECAEAHDVAEAVSELTCKKCGVPITAANELRHWPFRELDCRLSRASY